MYAHTPGSPRPKPPTENSLRSGACGHTHQAGLLTGLCRRLGGQGAVHVAGLRRCICHGSSKALVCAVERCLLLLGDGGWGSSSLLIHAQGPLVLGNLCSSLGGIGVCDRGLLSHLARTHGGEGRRADDFHFQTEERSKLEAEGEEGEEKKEEEQ